MDGTDSGDHLIWGMPFWVCWIVIAILLVITGIFSASENAFTNCNKYHFRAEAEKGKKYAKVITYLVDKFDNTLVTILVSSNTVATLMSFLSALLWYNVCVDMGWGSGVEALLSTVVMGVLFYVVADTIPKVISKSIPDQMAILMAYPILFLQIILFPLILLFRGILLLVHKIFRIHDNNSLSKEDLMQQVNVAINDETILEDEEEKDMLFEEDEAEILDNVMTFDTRSIKQVYIPLDQVFALDINGLTAEKLNEEITKTEFSRIPIYDETKDNIIGILVLRSYYQEYLKDPHLSIPSILEKADVIEASVTLDEAMHIMNRNKVHMAVVCENGKVLGTVTMEDILEQLVDDIAEDPTIDADAEVEHE